MKEVKLYFELIIKPIENEIKKLRIKANKKKFYITKNIESEQIEKLNQLRLNYYMKIGNFIDKDLNYNNLNSN